MFKRLFSLVCVLAVLTVGLLYSPAVDAQLLKTYPTTKDSLLNADSTTIKMLSVEDDVKSVQLVITRKSGTAAGKAVIKCSNDGINWETFGKDTLVYTNGVTNKKTWVIRPLDYAHYQIELTSTNGTAVLKAKAYAIKRRQ